MCWKSEHYKIGAIKVIRGKVYLSDERDLNKNDISFIQIPLFWAASSI